MKPQAERHTAMLITTATSKGGAGKTLLCMLLAGRLAEEGFQVVAVDADPTRALSRWASQVYEGAPFECIAETQETELGRTLLSVVKTADVVLCDTGGFANRSASMAMTAADFVLVPSQTGEADVTEAEKTLKNLASLAEAARRDIPGRMVFNRLASRTAVAKHALAEAARAELPRLQTTLSHLVAYSELSFSGRLPTAGAAGMETASLIAELKEMGWLPAKPRVRAA